ncbi:DNA-binding response regulator [Reticulibacter mediterranei]|uniref:DNA-binding response regulator n=1 Tax=Reticulibacter mediterranei TaxID=2778369 RepID=A0A8J3J4B0_9CHLR|nr:response regulator transcription factor [Reticulibacter mediterranei]GHP00462.1 DNA-binding response regulator [Reticulibacter mediterranei]
MQENLSRFPTEENITLVLIEDHPIMREGTRRLLLEDPHLKVIGEAENGLEAVALCLERRPQIVVLDINMKGMNGFSVAQALLSHREWKPEILVLTAYDQVAYVRAMLALGVKGYWLKSARGSDIRAAIHDLTAGKSSIAPEVKHLLQEEKEDMLIHEMEPLTSRELAVLHLVVQTKRNSDIALALHISIKTVETHLTSIYGKLGVQSRAETIAFAQRHSLLLEGSES